MVRYLDKTRGDQLLRKENIWGCIKQIILVKMHIELLPHLEKTDKTCDHSSKIHFTWQKNCENTCSVQHENMPLALAGQMRQLIPTI